MKTYLPELSISDLVHAFSSCDWSAVEEKLGKQQYERLGLDRAMSIVTDLYDRHGSLQGLKILDVGSNNGLVSKTLAAFGCDVVGIDNGDVDGQGMYSDLQTGSIFSGFEFQRKDLADFLNSDKRSWDCILLLSVAHHWETGYAMSGNRRYSDEDIKELLEKLFQKSKLNVYYECPSDEPGFVSGFGINFLFRYCNNLPKLRMLGHTIGPNGYPRELWALDME